MREIHHVCDGSVGHCTYCNVLRDSKYSENTHEILHLLTNNASHSSSSQIKLGAPDAARAAAAPHVHRARIELHMRILLTDVQAGAANYIAGAASGPGGCIWPSLF